jgi:hypothetical protein
MKIDLDALKNALDHLYACEAEEIDNSCRNDSLAICKLTSCETRQLRDNETIANFERIVDRVCAVMNVATNPHEFGSITID